MQHNHQLFADDLRLYAYVHSIDDSNKIQNDLIRHSEWYN